LELKKYLAIPATSASIESTFSIGGNILTKNRASLSPIIFKQIILLKSWKIKDISDLYNYRKRRNNRRSRRMKGGIRGYI